MRKIIAIILSFVLILPIYSAAAEIPESVIPGGHTVGLKIFTDGLLVVGHVPILTEQGEMHPAKNAGIVAGDTITHIDGKKVETITDLQEIAETFSGEPVEVRYIRAGEERLDYLTPAKSALDGTYRFGLWLRDSMAGIGTITFYDPATGLFGALGHGINDSETGILLPLGSGYILYSEVQSVRKGEAGTPGELRGNFRDDKQYGTILLNSDKGLFGILPNSEPLGPNPHKAIPIANPDEITEGDAIILSNVNGDIVEEFKAEIVKIYPNDTTPRDFMLRITDDRLTDITGGIVQGMSGSPVIKDGKLVGAVTHVLINDPGKGYGIFAKTMLEKGMEILESKRTSAELEIAA